MNAFLPDPPPLALPVAPDVLSPNIPLNPPMVGTADPWRHVDGQNRDIILESIRTWVRVSLLPWTTLWQTQLTDWETQAADQLNAWMELADAYITEYAVAGLSFRTTATPIAGAGTTNVVLAVTDAARPVVVGDLVLDEAVDGNYGIVTVVIDATHATVEYVGSLRGPQGVAGLSTRLTVTDIAGAGATNVVLTADDVRPFALNDLVITTQPDSNYGLITALIDDTHATVTYMGSLRGATGAMGPAGTNGHDGVMTSVAAGAGIAVDATDPANPIVSATGNGTLAFTDATSLNAAGGTDGEIAVLTPPAGNLVTSTWVRHSGKWVAVNLIFSSDVPSDWDTIAAYIDLGTNTNLSLIGCTVTEQVNGTHPYWNPQTGFFVQDKTANRWLELSPNTPFTGTYAINPDNTASLNGCDRWEQRKIAPTLERDGTDEYEVRIVGVLAANGSVSLNLTNSTGGHDTDPANYADNSDTFQQNPSGVSLDAYGFSNLGDAGQWPVVNDTTGSPIYLDATIKLSHAGEAGVATLGTIESSFYDALTMAYLFSKTVRLFYYNADGVGNDGVYFTFSQHFTGTIKAKTR